jgi:predicted RNase H-like HicB family nuclease
MIYADSTANFISGVTYTDKAYTKRAKMIDIIYQQNIEDCKLIKPISVNIERDYEDYVVSDSRSGIYSFGYTEEEAKANFCYAMENVFFFLLEDNKNLTLENRKTLNYLKKILRRK